MNPNPFIKLVALLLIPCFTLSEVEGLTVPELSAAPPIMQMNLKWVPNTNVRFREEALANRSGFIPSAQWNQNQTVKVFSLAQAARDRTKSDLAVFAELEQYLRVQGNDSIDIDKALRLIVSKAKESPLIIDLETGGAVIAYWLAIRNPQARIIATDRYDGIHYPEFAQEWRQRQLKAQREPSSNLVALRAMSNVIDYLPDHSLDFILLVNADRNAWFRVVDLFQAGVIQRKLKPGARFIMKSFENYGTWPDRRTIIGFPDDIKFTTHHSLFMGVDLDADSGFPGSNRNVYVWRAPPAVLPQSIEESNKSHIHQELKGAA